MTETKARNPHRCHQSQTFEISSRPFTSSCTSQGFRATSCSRSKTTRHISPVPHCQCLPESQAIWRPLLQGKPSLRNHHFGNSSGVQMATESNLLYPWFNCSTTAIQFCSLAARQPSHSVQIAARQPLNEARSSIHAGASTAWSRCPQIPLLKNTCG